MWYCWESNPYFNHGPQLDGLADFSAKMYLLYFILKRFSKCPTIFLKDSLDCLVWESLINLVLLLVCQAQEQGPSAQGTHPYVYLRNLESALGV